MSSIDEYRVHAEDCMRMALTEEHDKPLWATLAQSWLRLAEDADRIKSGRFARGNDQSVDDLSAAEN
jgi:hypothetical protein